MGGAFYTSMLDAVSDGVVAFSPDRRIIYCNQAFLDITGLDRSDLEHGLCAVMRGADTDLHTIAKIDEALANGKPFDGEVLNYRKSGEAFWNHLSFKPETDATGKVTHFIGISRDVTANRSTQTRFSQLERDYEFICENVLAGIIIRDPDSRVRYINPKAREMLGLTGDVTLDAATVERGWQLLRPDGSVMPTEEYPFYRALRERATVRGVLLGHRRTLDDKIVWALCDAFLANDDKGDVAAVLVSFTDVSRLIESEQTAHAYRERFELAARASQDVIFEWNIETGAFSANEAFKNVYGYEPPQIMGPGNLDARNAVETDQYAVRDITQKAIASGNERFSVDHMINRPDGSIGHLVIRAFIVRNPQGEALRVIGTVTDIGQLTAAVAELEESETRFRIIADTVSDILWDHNFETGRLWMTPDWNVKLGLEAPQEPVTTDGWVQLIDPADLEATLQSYREALKSDATQWEREYQVVGADQRKIDVAVKACILRRPDGKAYRVLGSVRDVTNLKRQQEGYSRARALEAVGQLTGGIAHDFNNLLMIILGNAELLSKSTLSEPDAESVALIGHAAENAATLTKRLLAFSGQNRLKASRVDMAALLDNMWPLLRAGLPESISLSRSIDENIWEANVDANSLEQAIINLAMNAKDAMPSGGEISILCENHVVTDDMVPNASGLAAGRYVLLSFSDTGSGMSEEVLSKAVEPYFTTKEFGKGTGLGLSTVYGFITQSGGSLTIHSEEGVGTTVNLYLTAGTGCDLPDTHAAVEAGHNPAPRHHRILVVEDQPDVRSHVERLLSRLGYAVVAASDAVSALALLKEGQTFDLLYTDIIMPGGMNGQELSKAAKQIAPGMRVLFTSGYPAAAFEHLGIEDQSSINILRKPYRAKELEDAIAKAISD